jgi:hypothetical protein
VVEERYAMIVVDGVEMLEIREAAALVRRTPETVRRWVWSGRLHARTSADRLLVVRAEVERMVAEVPRPLTLAEWADQAQAVLGPGEPGTTASDLVLSDRAARSAGR